MAKVFGANDLSQGTGLGAAKILGGDNAERSSRSPTVEPPSEKDTSGGDQPSKKETAPSGSAEPSEKTKEKPPRPVDRKVPDDEVDTGRGLARSLTLTNCVTMIVGCIIGSGIFISPTGVQEGAGSVGLSLIIWIVCGFWCALGAYCYAELGTLITKSGGDYAYIMEAFGPFIAFLRLWIESIVVRPAALAIVGMTFALYALRPIYPDCDPPKWSIELLALGMIVILCGINCWSVNLTTSVQDWFTYAKLAALIAVIGTGGYRFFFGGAKYRDSFDNLFEGTSRDISQPAVAFFSGLYAYQGWTYLNFVTEELINPRRNLPLAVMISMIIVTLVYVLYNCALYVVLSPDEMLISPAVAGLFAEKEFGKLAFLMPIIVAISTVGSANGLIMTSSRLFFCGAREGHMPVILAMINKEHRTPIPAVVFTCLVAVGYLFTAGHIYVLINASQVTIWIAIFVVTLALFKLRYSMPDAPRSVKVYIIAPIIFTIGTGALIVLSVIGAPFDTVFGLLILFSAVPIYVIFVCIGLPRPLRRVMHHFTAFWQKLFLLVDDNKEK